MEQSQPENDAKFSDDVLRKVGRNLMLFQQIEAMLKFVLSNGRVQGYAEEFGEACQRRATSVKNRTLGQLVRQFGDDVLTSADVDSGAPEELEKAWMSFTFNLAGDAAYYERTKADFAAVVAERNELIHHFLPRWNPNSSESTAAAGLHLDRQREKVLPIRDQLQSVIASLQDGLREQAEFIASAEGLRQLELSWLQQSRLVLLLGDIAQQLGGLDGWTPLGTAGRLVQAHAPEEVAAMKERLGQPTLKGLLLAAELFDVRDEPTAKGGVRTVYRIKPGWVLGPLLTESDPASAA